MASISIVAWVFSYSMHHVDRLVLRLSKGRHTAVNLLTGLPVVTLTAIGAKSGRARAVPLIGIPVEDKVVLIASNWGQNHHPSWYYNLKANPEVVLAIKGEESSYLASEVSGDEREQYWQEAVSIYAGYAAYKQRTGGREIPVMVLACWL